MSRRSENLPVPGPGQESVWDYPRPPAVVPDGRLVMVEFGGVEIVRSERSLRILETSHPPAFYIPPENVRPEYLESSEKSTFCEFKGWAAYFHLKIENRHSENAAWCYSEPSPGYEAIAGFYSFYPAKMDECTVGGHLVTPQSGDFYGGWITPEIVGPFKGEPGTMSW